MARTTLFDVNQFGQAGLGKIKRRRRPNLLHRHKPGWTCLRSLTVSKVIWRPQNKVWLRETSQTVVRGVRRRRWGDAGGISGLLREQYLPVEADVWRRLWVCGIRMSNNINSVWLHNMHSMSPCPRCPTGRDRTSYTALQKISKNSYPKVSMDFEHPYIIPTIHDSPWYLCWGMSRDATHLSHFPNFDISFLQVPLLGYPRAKPIGWSMACRPSPTIETLIIMWRREISLFSCHFRQPLSWLPLPTPVNELWSWTKPKSVTLPLKTMYLLKKLGEHLFMIHQPGFNSAWMS